MNVTCSPKFQPEPAEVHPAFTALNDQKNDKLEEFEITIRYFSEDNFVGRPIPGYNANKAFLTNETKRALLNAHKEFIRLGYKIKIFDAYRPQMAVDYFSFWAADLNDTVNKSNIIQTSINQNFSLKDILQKNLDIREARQLILL